jgi:CRP-like cAMP-binding protein
MASPQLLRARYPARMVPDPHEATVQRVTQLAAWPVLADAAQEVVLDLTRTSVAGSFTPKRRPFAGGDPAKAVFLLVKGSVRVDSTSRGRRTPIGFYQRGEVVGEEAVYVDAYTTTATPVSEVSAVLIPRDALRAALHADRHVALAWGRLMHERRVGLEMRLGDQGKASHVKLAAFLLDYAARFGSRDPKTGDVFIPDRPTDSIVAEYNGVVRQTVQRDYNFLEKQGAVRRAGEFYVDLKILREIADRIDAPSSDPDPK